MKSKLVLLVVLSFWAGCKNEPPARTSAPAAAPPPSAAVADPPPSAAPPDEAKPIEISEPLVAKFLVYEKEYIEALKAATAEMKLAAAKSGKEAGAREGMEALIAAQKATKLHEEGQAKARLKAGLNAEEAELLTRAVGDVATTRMAWKKTEGEVAQAEKAMRAAMANVPPEQRAEAAEQMKQMSDGFKNLRDAIDARKQYGDKAVDAILKHESEIEALREQILKVVSENH
jgi:formyltetrahydrofolate synthetase